MDDTLHLHTVQYIYWYTDTNLTLVTLQAEDLPVRWLVTRTNSTWSPG